MPMPSDCAATPVSADTAAMSMLAVLVGVAAVDGVAGGAGTTGGADTDGVAGGAGTAGGDGKAGAADKAGGSARVECGCVSEPSTSITRARGWASPDVIRQVGQLTCDRDSPWCSQNVLMQKS